MIRASGAAENGDGLKEGTKVKVTAEIKVYHAPKQADGLDLTGREGVVVKNVAYFKDKVLSPNLQYKVQFELNQDGGKASKFFAHLVSYYRVGGRGTVVQRPTHTQLAAHVKTFS